MYCPTCRAEFRPRFSECAGCDVALVEALPPQDFFPDIKGMATALAQRNTVPLLVGTLRPLQEAQNHLRNAGVMSAVVADQQQDDSPGMHDRLLLLVAEDAVDIAHEALGAAWNELLVREGVQSGAAPSPLGECPACGVSLPEDMGDAPVECGECGLMI